MSLSIPGLAFGTILAALALVACGDSSTPPSEAPEYDLVFEGYLTATPELLTVDRETGAMERLLPPGTPAMDPQPSPDGTRIAFVVADYEEWTGDIFLVDADGTGLVQITFAAELDDQPCWSPDGQRIAFRSYRAQREGDIWVMNADGTDPVIVTPDLLPGVSDEARPAWSPDGLRIAYASNANGSWDIWIRRADGSDPQPITDSPAFESEPAWSPDGTTLAFRRNGPEGFDLHLVPAGGGAAIPVLLAGYQRTPVWTPDGLGLVFVNQTSLSVRPDLYSASRSGGDLQPLVTDAVPGGSFNPAFLRRTR